MPLRSGWPIDPKEPEPLTVWLRDSLHDALDPTLAEPVPKQLLIEAGSGPAQWQDLRDGWRAGAPPEGRSDRGARRRTDLAKR